MAVDIEQLGSGSEEIAAITEEQSASVEQIATSSENCGKWLTSCSELLFGSGCSVQNLIEKRL